MSGTAGLEEIDDETPAEQELGLCWINFDAIQEAPRYIAKRRSENAHGGVTVRS
jgi:hypothetical protein